MDNQQVSKSIDDLLMEGGGSQPSQAQQAQPAQPPMPDEPAKIHKHSSGKLKIIIAVIIVLIVLGGGAFAAYYFNLIPGFKRSVINVVASSKEQALLNSFDKLKEVDSASYNSDLLISIEDRAEEEMSLREALADSFAEIEERHRRDYERVQASSAILRQLADAKTRGNAYPGDVNHLIPANVTGIQYALTANNQGFTYQVTLETDAAVEVFKRYIADVQVQDKVVTITHNNPLPRYGVYMSSRPIQPAWVEFMDVDSEFLAYLPESFMAHLFVNGTSQKVETEESTDASFQLGGDVDFGDISAAVDISTLKKGETVFGRIDKFPNLFFDLSDIKNKWVRATKQDLVYARSYGLDEFIDLDEQEEKSSTVLAQVRHIFDVAQEEGVLVVDMNLPNEMINNSEHFVYRFSFDSTKFASYYTRIVKEFEEQYDDDAIITFNQETADYINSSGFAEYINYVNNHVDFRMAVDSVTGYPDRFSIKIIVVPHESSGSDIFGFESAKQKQAILDMTLQLSDINKPVVIEEPTEYISFDEAQALLTGASLEQILLEKQIGNIRTLRTYLNRYQKLAGSYPNSLDSLLKSEAEITGIPFEETNQYNNSSYYSFNDYYKDQYEVPLLEVLPVDVTTGNPYTYRVTSGGNDFELVYEMRLESKETTTLSAQSYLSVAQGTNTATKDTMSRETDMLLATDTDGDLVPDYVEQYYGSNINSKDTDGDGFDDLKEIQGGYSPVGPGQLESNQKWSPARSGPNSAGYLSFLDDARTQARDAKRVADIKQIQTALELYATEKKGVYPECTDGAACNPDKNEFGKDITKIASSGFNGQTGTTYMGLVPSDPLSSSVDGSTDDCKRYSSGGCSATYKRTSEKSYQIDFYLENPVGNLFAGPSCATNNGILSGACK